MGEWAVGGLSAVLVLSMIGFILYQALSERTPWPELVVVAERIEETRGGFLVAFRAVNSGDGTAADVQIEGRLEEGDQAVETSEVTLDYVPGHSERKGGLLFERDPSQFHLQLNAKGYTEP